jgi:hypothetical protein
MSQQVTLFAQEGSAVLSKKFAPLVAAGVGTELGDGIKGSYGIVGIKAGKFRIKYKGEEKVLLNGDGTPVGYIDVVIVKANGFLNKQYFEGKYVEGNTSPPVCYSLDGVKPSDASTKKQAATCALCPKNQFGSLIGDNGVKQKACRDTKKLAVVPLADIMNVGLGGAMLFRVPPSSLKELSAMSDQLKGRGYPYNSVAVRISFDLDASHPKPIFKAIRPLDDAEADQVLEQYASDSVQRVLADNDVVIEHPEVVEPASASTPPPVQPAAYAPRNNVEWQAVPQAKATPADLLQPPPVQDLQPGQVAVQPASRGAVPVAPVADPTPRVLRVQPNEQAPAPIAAAVQPVAQPAAAASPFATAAPAKPVTAATPPAPQPVAETAQANPFAPPAAAPQKARAPVTIDTTAAEVQTAPAPAPQMEAEISNILAGLDSLG